MFLMVETRFKEITDQFDKLYDVRKKLKKIIGNDKKARIWFTSNGKIFCPKYSNEPLVDLQTSITEFEAYVKVCYKKYKIYILSSKIIDAMKISDNNTAPDFIRQNLNVFKKLYALRSNGIYNFTGPIVAKIADWGKEEAKEFLKIGERQFVFIRYGSYWRMKKGILPVLSTMFAKGSEISSMDLDAVQIQAARNENTEETRVRRATDNWPSLYIAWETGRLTEEQVMKEVEKRKNGGKVKPARKKIMRNGKELIDPEDAD